MSNLRPPRPGGNGPTSPPPAGSSPRGNAGQAAAGTGRRNGSGSALFAGHDTAADIAAATTGWQSAYQAAAPNAPALRDDTGDLRRVFAPLNPATQPEDAELVAAALVYVRCRGTDPQQRCVWARYAYRAARLLWGDAHPATLRISRVYQRLLTELGHPSLPAVLLCEQRLGIYQHLGLTHEALCTGADLSNLLHGAGCCAAAFERITDTWRDWRAGSREPGLGCLILLTRATILAGCGRTHASVATLNGYAGLLASASAEQNELTAQLLTTAERCHPAVCGRRPRPQPPADGKQRMRFWTGALHQAAAIRPDRAHPPTNENPA